MGVYEVPENRAPLDLSKVKLLGERRREVDFYPVDRDVCRLLIPIGVHVLVLGVAATKGSSLLLTHVVKMINIKNVPTIENTVPGCVVPCHEQGTKSRVHFSRKKGLYRIY
jgi:hypothetical protein